MSEQKELTLKSRPEHVKEVEAFITELKMWADLNDDVFGNAMMTITEAFNNAVLHGNQKDPDKEVHLIAKADDEKLTVTIEDEGEGFDPDSLPDPLAEENLLKDSGRGVFLIRQFADDVTYEKGGSRIVITFHR